MEAEWSERGAELAAVAARLVVEDGLEYAVAKRQAGKLLGWPSRGPWPDNATLDEAVREHIAIFCADTQATELAALRRLAIVWLERLADFRPHLGGAVWHGTATRHSDIHIQLFCDDPKAAEWRLLDRREDYRTGSIPGWKGEPVEVLSLRMRCEELNQWVAIHLMVHDLGDLRGALKPDSQGRQPRGNVQAVRALVARAEENQTL